MTRIYIAVILSTIASMNSVLCLPCFHLNRVCQTVFHGLPLFQEVLIVVFLQSGAVVREFGTWYILFSSVQFSRSVVSNSLRPRESQHSRPPYPSPTPGVYPNPHPSSWWCHSAISSFVVPFSSCPQFFPTLGSFPMSQLFAWGGQSIEVSASTSVLSMNTQDWSPLGWTGWIFLQSKGLSRVFSNTTVRKHDTYCSHTEMSQCSYHL